MFFTPYNTAQVWNVAEPFGQIVPHGGWKTETMPGQADPESRWQLSHLVGNWVVSYLWHLPGQGWTAETMPGQADSE